MRHIDDGALRRLYDEPLALSAAQRAHYDSCGRCRERHAAFAADARAVADLFATPIPRANPAPAWAQLQRRLASEGTPVRRQWTERIATMAHSRGRRLVKPLGGIAVAAALVGALVLTPAGSLAADFITVFEPTTIAQVPITSGDLQSLPDLSQYGTMSMSGGQGAQSAADASVASTAAGYTVLTPDSSLPGVPATVSYNVLPQEHASFTFSAAKAASSAAGKPLPAMPDDLNGSTLDGTVGPVAVATYGGQSGTVRESGVDIPALIIAQAPSPKITSTGASTAQIEDYLLSLPGISSSLATAIRNIGDPTSTLPIPIPIDLATAQQVTVQGVQGLAIGDNTGIGSGVVWDKDGMIYGVAGPLPESQVLAIANSLH